LNLFADYSIKSRTEPGFPINKGGNMRALLILVALLVSTNVFATAPKEVCEIDTELKVVYGNYGRGISNGSFVAIVEYNFDTNVNYVEREEVETLTLTTERLEGALRGTGQLKATVANVLYERSLARISVKYILKGNNGTSRFINVKEYKPLRYQEGQDRPEGDFVCYQYAN
jgi:hypothetical protein